MTWFVDNWIWLLLLACVGIHFFGHGHGRHAGHDDGADSRNNTKH